MPRARIEPRSDKFTTMRARVRTLIARRKRFWTDLTVFVVLSGAMVVATIANRDTQHFRTLKAEAEQVAETLQAYLESNGEPPLLMPPIPGRSQREIAQNHYFNIFYAQQARAGRPAGVCCPRNASAFYFRDAGRMVILFDGEAFTPHWYTNDEFHLNADRLGLGRLLDE